MGFRRERFQKQFDGDGYDLRSAYNVTITRLSSLISENRRRFENVSEKGERTGNSEKKVRSQKSGERKERKYALKIEFTGPVNSGDSCCSIHLPCVGRRSGRKG